MTASAEHASRTSMLQALGGMVIGHAKDAMKGLVSNMQRSVLALAGIVIGIASVIALLTVGNIARNEAIKQFEALGTDLVSVFDTSERSEARKKDILDTGDAVGLVGLSTITAASPYAFDSVEFTIGNGARRTVRRVGVSAAFAELHDVVLAAGRFISPFDGRRLFAVIGSEVASEMREAGIAPDIGTNIRLGDSIFTIVGVLAPGASGPQGVRVEGSVLVPIEVALRALGSRELLGITLRLEPGIHYLTATSEIQAYFKRTAPAMRVRVQSPVRLVEQMEKQMRLFAVLLGAVAGIALVVGGFGIMNAMLASVTERRTEIGIRRALGARQRDIQFQFLAESSVLCVLGGLIGAALGIGATLIISAVVGWTWLFSAGAVVLGVATAIVVGLVFGYFPARQAARLDPIAALRDP